MSLTTVPPSRCPGCGARTNGAPHAHFCPILASAPALTDVIDKVRVNNPDRYNVTTAEAKAVPMNFCSCGRTPGEEHSNSCDVWLERPVISDLMRGSGALTATAVDAKPTKDTNPKDSIGDTKVPLWLLSPIAKAHWALAQFAGMLKYGSANWRVAGVRKSVYISAAMRHLDAYLSGEELDPVDGTNHLGNVMACCAILLDAEAAGKVTEDRPPRVDHRPTYAAVEAQMAVLKAQYASKKPHHYTINDKVSA